MKRIENLEFARVDLLRSKIKKAGEVIFCKGKTPSQVERIAQVLLKHQGKLLATQAEPEHFKAIRKISKKAVYNETAKVVRVGGYPKKGLVAVVSAGTLDIPVAEEAYETATFLGANVKKYYDVGIAGLHRIIDILPELKKARAIVAIAGMEGALPSVIASLVEKPVIGVPTSVGYGTGIGGFAALLTMLNACSPGIAVVNIDNGFGAGYIAALINSK